MLQQMQTLAQKQVHCSSFVCYLSSDWPSSIPGTFQPNSFPFEFIFGLCAVLFSLPHFLSTFLQQTFGFFSRFIEHEADPDRPIPQPSHLIRSRVPSSRTSRGGRWAV